MQTAFLVSAYLLVWGLAPKKSESAPFRVIDADATGGGCLRKRPLA